MLGWQTPFQRFAERHSTVHHPDASRPGISLAKAQPTMTRHAKPRHTALALSIASLCFTWASCTQPLVIKQTPSNEYQRDSGRYRVGSPERLRIEDLTFDKAIPTPASFLGYEIGDQYTRHPDAIAYFKLLAEASKVALVRLP